MQRASDSLSALARAFSWRPAELAVHLGGLAVLSRLLEPAAFGTFAVALALFEVGEAVVDFGLSTDLLRRGRERLDPEALARALGLGLTVAGLASLVFGLAAWGVTRVLAAPDLGGVLLILGAVLPVSVPLKLQEVRLQHALDLRLLAPLPVLGAVASVSVSAVLAVTAGGAVALAAGLLTDRALRLALLRGLGGEGLGWPRFDGWRRQASFGLTFTATQLLPKLSVAGRLGVMNGLLGADAVGHFNRGETVARLTDRVVLQTVAPLVLPVMTRSLRDGQKPRDVYLEKVEVLAAVCWPSAGLIVVLAEPLVTVLLGRDWQELVPLVRILAVSVLAFPVTRMSAKLFAMFDAEGLALRLQAGQQVLAFGLVAGAAFVSLPAACAATSAAHLIKGWRVARAFHRLLAWPRGAMSGLVARNVAVSLATVAPMPGVLALMPEAAAWLVLATGIGAAAAGWLAGLVLVRHRLWPKITAVLALIVGRAAHLSGRR